MNVGSLFSGIGGLDLGLARAGFRHAFFCEDDPDNPAAGEYRRAVLREHFPGVPVYGDVRALGEPAWGAPADGADAPAHVGGGKPGQGYPCVVTLPARLKKLTPEQVAEAVTLYGKGWSCQALGTRYGVSRQSMWDLLRRRTTMRPKERYGKDNHFWRGTKADDRAQNLLEQAIEDGVITRKTTCERCGASGTFKDGRTKIQAHHSDYAKPLEVEWLCQRCHHEWHRVNVPKGVMPQEAESTSWSEASRSCAKTSPSPDEGPDSQATAPASSSSLPGSQSLFDLDGYSSSPPGARGCGGAGSGAEDA